MHLAVALHDELAAAPVGDAHAYAGVLHGAGDTHRIAVFYRFVIGGLDGLQRFHQAGGVIHDLAVGQHTAGANGVAVADLPGGDAHQVGHLVQQRLGAEAGLGDAEAPEGAGGGVVGVVGAALDLEVLVGVGTGGVGAGALQHGAAQRGKRAGVGYHAGLDTLNDAVFVAAHGEVHVHAVALGMDEDGLLAAELELDGALCQITQQRGVVLHGHILLAAEAAAHQAVLHLAVVVVHAQHGRALMHGGVGTLVRGQQLYAAVVQRQRHAALRLQEGVLRPRGGEVLGQHIFGVFDSALGIAAGDVLVGLDVALLLVEHQWRAGGGGLGGVMDGGQDFIFHLHQLLGGLHRLLIHGADQCHTVAQVVYQLAHADQGGLVLLQMAYVHLAGNILLRGHADHAGQRLGFAGVDGENAGAGILAADRAAIAHTVHIDIIRVLAIALHLLGHVQSVDAAAHLPVFGGWGGQLALAEYLSRQQDAVDDLHVAGAAADIVADGEGGLLAGGIGVHVQQPLGGDDHAGDAEAALYRAGLAEGEGVDLLFPVAEPLYREDGLALQLVRLGDAGLGGLAVDEDVAGAAGTLAASVLDGGQVQLVPQKADELLVLFHSDGLAVHGKCRHSVSLLCARPGLSLVFAEIIARERRKNKVRTAAFCPRRDSISRISDKKKEAAQGGSFKQKLSYVSSTGSMICSRNWPCRAENTHRPPLRWAMAWMLRHP